MRHLLLTTALILPLPAFAQDTALILGNARYEQLDRVVRADDLLGAVDRLESLGFVVHSRANGRVDTAKDLAAAFQAGLEGADRLVVALSGHFVTDGHRTWLLTAEAAGVDLFTVDTQGLSVDSVLRLLAERPGKAVLLLGAGDARNLDLGESGLQEGIAELQVPQGVTVLQGTPTVAGRLLGGLLTEPEAEIGARLLADGSVTANGFLPRDWVLMPSEIVIEQATAPVVPTEDLLNAEARLWDTTTAADTVEAYRSYLDQFPRGRFADDAEEQIAAILAEPNRAARLAEEALSLNREARRGVQANLTFLNYNTRGVDGIFGPGTRGAITNWQQTNGFPQTSYLTRDQINLLEAQAARRRAEIEAEEERARAQAEALDRSYWAETGGRQDEPGYRAYLDRYPEGLFANIARARLADIEERRRAATEMEDRAAWSVAQADGSATGYREYLAAYPQGVFADEALSLIEELEAPVVDQSQIDRARAEEEQLRLSGVRGQLLELRLRDLGFDPGRLDGVIDANTRAAISAYQEDRDLPVTGYVDQRTAVGLITGSVGITIPSR